MSAFGGRLLPARAERGAECDDGSRRSPGLGLGRHWLWTPVITTAFDPLQALPNPD